MPVIHPEALASNIARRLLLDPRDRPQAWLDYQPGNSTSYKLLFTRAPEAPLWGMTRDVYWTAGGVKK